MTPGVIILWLVGSIACGLLGAWVGGMRGQDIAGGILGLLLGPLGILIAVLLPAVPEAEPLLPRRALARPAPSSPPPPASHVRIRRGDTELSPIPPAALPAALRAGTLCPDDHYLDPECADWIPLHLHPSLHPLPAHNPPTT